MQNINGIVFSKPISFVCQPDFAPENYNGISNSYFQTIFQDDFDDNNNGWPLEGDSYISYSISNGSYLINHTRDGYFYSPLITLSSFDSSSDYQVEAYMKMNDDYNDNSGSGILWATNSFESFYNFLVFSSDESYCVEHR